MLLRAVGDRLPGPGHSLSGGIPTRAGPLLTPGPTCRIARLTAVILGMILIGCSASSSPAASGPVPASAPAGEDEACAAIDLRTPSGERLDLTGTWRADDARFFVAQFGDCVWWEELSAEENGPLGERFRRLFAGHLQADFTVIGRFGMIYIDPSWIIPAPGFVVPRSGEAVYRVVIRQEGGTELITLEGPARESTEGSFRTIVLTRIASGTELPQP